MLKLVVALVLLLTCGASAAPLACGKLPTSTGAVSYCIADGSGTSKDVLYLFHGGTDAENPVQQFVKTVDDLDVHWRRAGQARPISISISWGPAWFLTAETMSAFVGEVMPALEKLLPQPVRRRLILGASTGGFNAYLAWAQAPQLFDAVSLLCPAFFPVSPFSSRLVQYRHAQRMAEIGGARTAAQARDINRIFNSVLRSHFKTQAEWDRYQPKAVLKTISGRRMPPLYIVYNRGDALALSHAPELGQAGHDVTYELREGGHCADPITPGLATFLATKARPGS